MRFAALACDYDGTIADHGIVSEEVVGALERLRDSGRARILVTGRELPDLQRVFSRLDLFEWVVAENGALLFNPAQNEQRTLADPPPADFVEALKSRGVTPLSVGNVIVATWHPQETAVLEVIRELGLEHQVIFNKGAVMVLPPGVNKATGLRVALKELGISRHNTVGVGDAENDHAFLADCECAVAVANAVPGLAARVDWVTTAARGQGVMELIDALVDGDLAALGPDKSFYFRGPDGRLNLRAQNLLLFLQLGEGVDDETWLHHLRQGDYSSWIRQQIKDDDLADQVADIERSATVADESRRLLREAVEHRYTLPA